MQSQLIINILLLTFDNEKNGQFIPPLLTDTTRWNRLAFNNKGVMAIQFMNDSLQFYTSSIDTIRHFILLHSNSDT
jgi:hypothetical protein